MDDVLYVTQHGIMDCVSVVRVENGRSFIVADVVARGGLLSSHDLAERLCACLQAEHPKKR